jgi:HEAT repeat protein
MLSLLGGDAVDRCRALALVDRAGVPEQIGILVALTTDPHPDVRATAAALLARNVDQGHGGLLALEAVRSASRDPGTEVPAAVARALSGAATPAAQEIRDSLRHHRSARVRRASLEA